MNLKWKKKYLGPILGLVGAAVLIGGVNLYSSSNIQPDHQKEFKQRIPVFQKQYFVYRYFFIVFRYFFID